MDHIQNRILWILASTQTLIYFSFRCFGKHRRVRERKINRLFSFSPTLDCDQSLFFFRFRKGVHARASSEWLSLKDARNEGVSRLAPSATRVVICVSRAFCSTDQEKWETACSLPPPLPLCAGSQ